MRVDESGRWWPDNAGVAIPTWLGWLIAVVAFGLAFGWMMQFILKVRARFNAKLPIPDLPVPMFFYGSPDPARLSMAINYAVSALIRLGPPEWTKELVWHALDGVMIEVMTTGWWLFGTNKVGGLQLGNLLEVDKDLGSLLHEMAHRIGDVIDHDPDAGHTRWQARGITAADTAFRMWLSPQILRPAA